MGAIRSRLVLIMLATSMLGGCLQNASLNIAAKSSSSSSTSSGPSGPFWQLSGNSNSIRTSCYSWILNLRDKDGNPLPAPNAMSVTLAKTGDATPAFFSEGSCTTTIPGGVIAFPFSATSYTFYVKGPVAESVVLSASDSGSFASSASANINFANLVTMSCSNTIFTQANTTTCTSTGGYSPYFYSVLSGPLTYSGGGVYGASGAGGAIAQVLDSYGNLGTLALIVNPYLAITPPTKTLGTNFSFTFSASGGVAPYTYSITSGGGTINSVTGAYLAPATPGAVQVTVTDALSNSSSSSVTIVSTPGKLAFITNRCITTHNVPASAGTTNFSATCSMGGNAVFIYGKSSGSAYTADEHCRMSAQAAGLPNWNNFIAYASASGDDAYCRLLNYPGTTKAANCGQGALPTGGGPWYRVAAGGGYSSADLIANNITALTGCATGQGNFTSAPPSCLTNPITMTELGNSNGFYTHSDTQGTGVYYGSGCSWTTYAAGCMTGNSGWTDKNWLAGWFGGGSDTYGDRHLYCFEK